MTEKSIKRSVPHQADAGGGSVYGLGMIGAAVYFFKQAQGRRDYALAIPKSVVWPALLVYQLFSAGASPEE